MGADDYLAKPFSPRELVLRVQSVLRRVAAPLPLDARAPTVVVDGDLKVGLRAHEVWRGGHPLALSCRYEPAS
jgi:DNA-binding response OmpR family regulator